MNIKKRISISLVLACSLMIFCFIPIANAANVDGKVVNSDKPSVYWEQFLEAMATDEEFAKTINEAKELGIEFVDIKELGLEDAQMDELFNFKTSDQLLDFSRATKETNTFTISEADLMQLSTDDLMSEASTEYNTVSKYGAFTPAPDILLWQNIYFSYTRTGSSSNYTVSNVKVLDSYYSGLVIALSRVHQSGSLIDSGTVLTATGRDTYGVNIFGIPVGIVYNSVFNIAFSV